ncbi:hypothetical protein WA1_50425 [Scytonema hofmannii PCC 7110]|uniref:TIR domain-containing protein n=1 Tax=Scytonema hofmannii PCC 7110 TaxID=128403 RepID=A0A139WQD7_9CYAN|nr:AAA-like domain-containing protein [Scytonema hofmannii]KYC34635.1 hypothetical protein WA1_50425 [Scytonema hofmannii PCC 7110]
MGNGAAVKKILILAANPKDTPHLRLDQEVRDIEEGLERAQKRDQFVIVKKTAVRPRDFRRALMDVKPQIVHFCGHGLKQEGIALENEVGKVQLVNAKALSGLFDLFSKQVKCVLLNACYSEEQAEAISQHINYVVGMNQAIGDKAAIEFAVAFYDALAAEDNALEAPESVEFAYRLGCSAIEMAGVSGSLIPVLKKKPKSTVTASENRTNTSGEEVSEAKLGMDVVPKSVTKPARVFLSYRSEEPDMGLAHTFYDALKSVGHKVFMAGENIRLGENWAQRIYEELEQCDYFMLLLSPQSAFSEMVTEEVRRAKELSELRSQRKPVILPIRVNFPLKSPLNYELRAYLSQIQQREWQAADDTSKILQEVLNTLAAGEEPLLIEPREVSLPQADSDPDHPPLPVAEPELQREPGGTIPLNSSLYIERSPIETDCYWEIKQPGALIRVKAPRQMGKTSLMARILNHAREQGYQAISLSFQRADSTLFVNLDRLLRWFSEQVGRRLKRLNQLDDYWSKGTSMDKCTFYFEECLLEELDSPLVLGLDEVDRVFSCREVADDFFALLRSWFEAARIGDYSSDLWKNLRLVIVHSTEVYVPLNINQSPFNVGKNIELLEFNINQVKDLMQRYGLNFSKEQIEQLMTLVGGHPYLVRKALYHIRRRDVTLEQLMKAAPTEAGIYSDHLRRHLLNIQQYPQLMEALRQVVTKSRPVEIDPEPAFKLDSMGLIKLQGNEALPRCDLYRHYFRDHIKI